MFLCWGSENWHIHVTAEKRACWCRLGPWQSTMDQPTPHPPRHLYLRGFSISEASSQVTPLSLGSGGGHGHSRGCPGQTAPSSHPWPARPHTLEHHIF